MAACFIAAPALSNPVNPTVVNGAATFSQVGNVLTVTNSNGAIINWDKFSIKAGETTHFAQTSASSSVLNRVLADPTLIYGTLSSNGRVWLVNPAGIMVGAGGRVDVAGFVATTLAVRNEDFLAGRNLFINDGTARNVVNQGEITTPAGGSVYLIGANVSNESVAGVPDTGIITTPGGETILAAGATVSLIDSALPGVKVDITGAEGNATNLGTIVVEAGRIGIAGVIVRNSGTLNASSVVNEGGRIFLKASQDAYVDGNGRIVTTGTKGGQVEVLGNRVAVMDNAEIDASGENGGGKILVGGDYQGKNPDIQNSQITYFGPDATLKADATEVGDGGTVIVWADDTTRAYGNISARGGALGGNGGFVETSGLGGLSVSGARVDTRAPNGHTGNWLLDPTDIQIVSGPYGGPLGSIFAPISNSTITDGDVNAALGLSGVTIQTSGGSGGVGNITVTGVNIVGSDANDTSLSLLAYGGGGSYGGISISNSSINLFQGSLTLVAGWDGSGTNLTSADGTDGSLTITDSTMWAGPIVMKAVGDISVNGVNTGTWIQGTTMNVWAGHDLTLTGGSGNISSSQGPGVMLTSTGTQTITAGNQILLQAGDANNTVYAGSPMYGGSVAIRSDAADQTISANVIKLYAGDSGHDNGAEFQAYGSQMINITGTGGLLELRGGGDSSTAVYGGAGSFNNSARIQHGNWFADNSYYGAGVQTITINNGSVNLQGGSGTGVLGYYGSDCWAAGGGDACRGGSNDAAIHNGFGAQTLDFVAAGSLSIYGGTAGTQNWAGINNQTTATTQTITGNPNITVTGGSGGGGAVNYDGQIFHLSNDAGINSQGAGDQVIYGGSITLNAGSATYGGAGIGNDDSVYGLNIYTTGDLSMYGGASSAGDSFASGVYIGNKGGGVINLEIGGDLYAKAGSGTSSPVMIGTIDGEGDVTINTAGNVSLVADGSSVNIGSYSTGYGSVTINAGGDIVLTGSATQGVMIGSQSDQYGSTTVNLHAGHDITATGNTGGVWLGVKTPSASVYGGSSVTMKAGWDGLDGFSGAPSDYGGDINLTGLVSIRTDAASGSVEIVAEESSDGLLGSIDLGSGTTVYGGNIEVIAGGNNTIAGTLISTGDIYLDAGWSDSVRDPSQRGGDLTLAATSDVQAGSWGYMRAYIGTVSGSGGNIIQQYGGSLSADGFVWMSAARDLTINGSVTSDDGEVQLFAGLNDGGDGGVSTYGGDITLTTGSFLSGFGGVALYASNGFDYGDMGGNILQEADSTISSGDDSNITIISAGNTTLNGTVSSGSEIGIGAGLDPLDPGASSGLGGDITFGSGSIIRARNMVEGNAIKAVTYGGSLNNGDITQSASSQLILDSYVGDVQILAYGDARMDGTTSIPVSWGEFPGSGNVSFTAGADNSSGMDSSSYDDGVRAGSSNSVSIGSLSVVDGIVRVEAAGAILRSDGNSSGINISADSVYLTSVYGGSPGGLAISAFVEAGSLIEANVNSGASYGGISIANFGAQPGTVSLIDNATNPGSGLGGAPSSIAFKNSGDLALDNTTTFSTGNSGDIAITSGGNLDYSDGGSLSFGGNNILLSAGGDLTMSSGLSATGSLKLGAGGILGIGSAISSGDNVELAAPVINIDADVSADNNVALISTNGTINLNAGVTAYSTSATPSTVTNPSTGVTLSYSGIAFFAKDMVANGSSAYLDVSGSATGDISALVSGNITLTNGAYFKAGNDIDIILTGAASTLSLSNGSYFLADAFTGIPQTISLDFTSRSSGGVMIDGKETVTSVVGGSGFFEPNLSAPATLAINYGVVGVVAIDPCVANPDLCKPPVINDSPIDQDAPPPPPDTARDDPLKPTVDLDNTTGGTEGTFGAESDGSSNGDNPPTDAKKDDEDKKDKKDDKDKKSDQAKDEKKDEKPAQKKVAQCT